MYTEFWQGNLLESGHLEDKIISGDNIEKGPWERGCLYRTWMGLAHDRVRRRASVLAMLKFRVLISNISEHIILSFVTKLRPSTFWSRLKWVHLESSFRQCHRLIMARINWRLRALTRHANKWHSLSTKNQGLDQRYNNVIDSVYCKRTDQRSLRKYLLIIYLFVHFLIYLFT
jgi:hypothetical protein